MRHLILAEVWLLEALITLYRASGLEERTEWVMASLSLQAAMVIVLVILRHSALAAVTALLASFVCSSVAKLEEERFPASLDRRRNLDWAAVTSGCLDALGSDALPSLTLLFVAAAKLERVSLVDWRRMETADREELSDQVSLNLAKLSPKSSW